MIGRDLDAARDFIAARLQEEDVCVLTSGDPGCFSILRYLSADFGDAIEVVPGIAAVQLLAARLREPWDGWDLVSFHGRNMTAAEVAATRPTVIFCDSSNNPGRVAAKLLAAQGDREAAVGADMGMQGERVWRGRLAEVAKQDFPGNALLLAGPLAADPVGAAADAPGIPDELWLRQEGVPLSKSEVRAVLLAKAQPRGRGVIWDVGSGTGSYAIECALLEPAARVVAVEKKPEACTVIAANADRFGAAVEVVCDAAPGCLPRLTEPDLAIIGGNDGRLEAIFPVVLEALRPGGRLAVTALLERTRKAAHGLFAGSGLARRQATRVAVARGKATEWDEQNPVVIFTGDKE